MNKENMETKQEDTKIEEIKPEPLAQQAENLPKPKKEPDFFNTGKKNPGALQNHFSHFRKAK
jgi:hypothetical protein